MALGPGKYDDACTLARSVTGGQVILIVLGGGRGSGFACQCEENSLHKLPELLESIAGQIRQDAGER
jgi:hypothetical protein